MSEPRTGSRPILVHSMLGGSLKTTTTVVVGYLAACLYGMDVLLVDLDIGAPGLTSLYLDGYFKGAMDGIPTLTHLLQGKADATDIARRVHEAAKENRLPHLATREECKGKVYILPLADNTLDMSAAIRALRSLHERGYYNAIRITIDAFVNQVYSVFGGSRNTLLLFDVGTGVSHGLTVTHSGGITLLELVRGDRHSAHRAARTISIVLNYLGSDIRYDELHIALTMVYPDMYRRLAEEGIAAYEWLGYVLNEFSNVGKHSGAFDAYIPAIYNIDVKDPLGSILREIDRGLEALKNRLGGGERDDKEKLYRVLQAASRPHEVRHELVNKPYEDNVALILAFEYIVLTHRLIQRP